MEILLQIWEWLGVVTALIYVYLATKAKRSCFIFGLVSSIIFTQICFTEKLFFDTAINAYYIAMSVVGWLGWNASKEDFPISSLKRSHFVFIGVGIILSSWLLGWLSTFILQASLPYVDAFTTVAAVVATFMLVRKIIEHWIIWVVADGVSIFMYVYKDHLPMAGLFLIYTVIAVYGFISWKKLEAIQSV